MSTLKRFTFNFTILWIHSTLLASFDSAAIACCNVYKPLIHGVWRNATPRTTPRFGRTFLAIVGKCFARWTARLWMYSKAHLSRFRSHRAPKYTKPARQTHPVYLTIIFRPTAGSTTVTSTHNITLTTRTRAQRGASGGDEKEKGNYSVRMIMTPSKEASRGALSRMLAVFVSGQPWIRTPRLKNLKMNVRKRKMD